MESYKSEFIEFMVESDVLKFGDFTLKSGRKSPFFMNAGAYVTGSQLKKLGEYYTREFHWLLLPQLHSVNCTEKRSVTAVTARKPRITGQTKADF